LFQVLKLDKLSPVGDYNLRSRDKKPNPTITPESISVPSHSKASDMANLGEDPPRNDPVNNEEGDDFPPFVPRTLRDYHIPKADDAQGPIVLPHVLGDPPSFGSGVVNLIQQNCYHGLEVENPHEHLNNFLQCCQTVKCARASMEYVKLALFPFSLRDKAKIWFNSLSKGSVGT
jgi:hypothetical protein